MFSYWILFGNYITELCCGIVLQNQITELYHGIILRNHHYEKDAGIPGEPRSLLGPPGPPGHAPGTTRERPGDPEGIPWDHHVLQKQPYLHKLPAPESFDCCIRVCSAHRICPKTPLDRFIVCMCRTEPFLVGHRTEPGETQVFRGGWTPMGERSLPIVPPGQAPLYISINHKLA